MLYSTLSGQDLGHDETYELFVDSYAFKEEWGFWTYRTLLDLPGMFILGVVRRNESRQAGPGDIRARMASVV